MKLQFRSLDATNTKTRRLAYPTAIISMLGRRGLSERVVCNKLVNWDQKSNRLRNYWVQTGEITSTYAAKRYLNLATNLGLIATTSGNYKATRVGLVLWELVNDQDQRSVHNPFYLTESECLFYMYLILERDADMLLTIADMLLDEPGISLSQVQNSFKDMLIKRLNRKLKVSQDERVKQRLLDRRDEVMRWEKSERYAEHIAAPRVNWLLDLDMLAPGQFRKHRYYLNETGTKILTLIPKFGDEPYSDITDGWLQGDYWVNISLQSFGSQISMDRLGQTNPEVENDLKRLLAKTFKRFQYTAIPKNSLTQVLIYLSVKCTLELNLQASPNALRNWLKSSPMWDGRKYEVRLSPREQESFLIAVST